MTSTFAVSGGSSEMPVGTGRDPDDLRVISPLLRRASRPDGLQRINGVTPGDVGWTYLSYAVHRLDAGQGFRRAGDDEEVALVILEGSADVSVG